MVNNPGADQVERKQKKSIRLDPERQREEHRAAKGETSAERETMRADGREVSRGDAAPSAEIREHDEAWPAERMT